ncbi:MAG: arginine deiminase family protein [Alphaproteobacteria bacterium]|nr:arginine deiminase family protein [Alphaproteobacteria bacterium]
MISPQTFGLASETAPLTSVMVKSARRAFGSQAALDGSWEALNYLYRPNYDAAVRESDAFAELLAKLGGDVRLAGPDSKVGPDSIYVRDAAVVTPRGAVLCRMGKGARSTEPEALAQALEAEGVPVLGAIRGAGRLEGGDLVWFDDGTVAIAEGYRSNAEGIDQFRALVGDAAREVMPVPLPHWNGPDDVLHLMSFISPLAPDLMLVYSRIMPVPFRRRLLEMGCTLIEVPDDEYDSMGCNVLAVRPGVCIAVEGNPETRRRMEDAGCEVHTYQGQHISAPGCGGPTCLTRPLARG